MEVTVEKRNVYGTEKVYPVCDKAKLLADLTGNTTLTPYTIQIAKQLGFTFKLKQDDTI